MGRRTQFVLKSPDSSFGPLFVPRGPVPSRGALIRLSGPWFVPRALIRPAVPLLALRAWSVPQDLIRFDVPRFIVRVLVRPAGPRSISRSSRLSGPCFVSPGPDSSQGWRNDSRGGGLGLGGPWGKGSPSVSKGPKPPIQLLLLLKNGPREVKRAHFVIYWVPPVPPRNWN